MKTPSKKLSDKERTTLLKTLEERFVKHPQRHKGMMWSKVLARIEKDPAKLRSLFLMEESGGEPDVIGVDKKSGAYLFVDCSPESPKERRSMCYDAKGQAAREKEGINMKGNVLDAANAMGITVLDEATYRLLQTLGEFDLKSQSWLMTPERIHKLGGAIYGDRRYDTIFVYHNSAPSFYANRGFRGMLHV